jgi:CheY-like chemotaxis protein
MAFKRALVVDDSRSARLALKMLLEQNDLKVHFAETGEEAIDFLKTQTVDVIFMDHSMPGMTGLEAVSVIKGNPRTAMIPVMMYTAKEGEVYVGQARALGAVGVLPKQVHPGALFDMLLKLGLVKDRRARPRAEAAEATPPAEKEVEDIDRQYERQAVGMSVQALVSRILEDQHTVLRSDILSSHRNFAKLVAAEIYEKQRSEEARLELAAPTERKYGAGAVAGVALLFLVPVLILMGLTWQAREERDAALAENARLSTATEEQIVAAQAEASDLLSDIDAERMQYQSRYLSSLDALEWAVNRGGSIPFDEPALNEARLEPLEELLAHLVELGFKGTVRLDAHLGEFCLEDGDAGGYRLPAPDTPVDQCAYFGHPLDRSDSISDRQTVGFANFLATSPLVNDSGIEVRVVAHSRNDSVRRYPFPANLQTAGQWNRIAEMNNRIQYSLVPGSP